MGWYEKEFTAGLETVLELFFARSAQAAKKDNFQDACQCH